ncbi:hypothetical protein GCM10010245_38010 [Streptomyces spectabilis]|nr:hypothetical protein GCM10010245_38010 [Streptomyces spectabilis]
MSAAAAPPGGGSAARLPHGRNSHPSNWPILRFAGHAPLQALKYCLAFATSQGRQLQPSDASAVISAPLVSRRRYPWHDHAFSLQLPEESRAYGRQRTPYGVVLTPPGGPQR